MSGVGQTPTFFCYQYSYRINASRAISVIECLQSFSDKWKLITFKNLMASVNSFISTSFMERTNILTRHKMSSGRHMEKGSKTKEKARLSLNSNKQYKYIDKKTRQEVYDALYALEVYQNIGTKAKVPDIRWWLDERRKEHNKQIEADGWAYYKSGHSPKTEAETRIEIQKEKKERTISDRHIERILKTDSRIVKGDGNTYHIDKEARFETRYQRPDLFGQDMLHAIMDGLEHRDGFKNWKTIQDTTGDYHDRINQETWCFCGIQFHRGRKTFQGQMYEPRERNELVDYWKKNAIDIDGMFDLFGAILGTEWTSKREDKTLAPGEVNESDINKMLESFKKSCPDIYENLILARREQVLSLDEVGRKENGEIGFVHGKTYRQGRTKY